MKYLPLIIAAMLLVIALAGCATQPTGTGTTGSQEISEQEQSATLDASDQTLIDESTETEIGDMV